MWVLFDGGFVSIVQHRDRPGHLLVRARVRADLAAFRSFARSRARIIETPEADYAFRATMPVEVVGPALASIAERIDYDNFKNAVAERQGRARAHVYGDVWTDLLALQGARPDPLALSPDIVQSVMAPLFPPEALAALAHLDPPILPDTLAVTLPDADAAIARENTDDDTDTALLLARSQALALDQRTTARTIETLIATRRRNRLQGKGL